MRGSIKQRFKGSWSVIVDAGYETDPTTGLRKRRQKYVTVRGTKKDAEKKLAEMLAAVNGDTYIEPSKLTLIDWLREWLKATVKPTARPGTYTHYRGIVENHIAKATIADMLLQKVRPTHLESYYATLTGAATTKAGHHTVINRALRKAVRDRLVTVNVAADLEGRPKQPRNRSDDARTNCWSAEEAQAFLASVKLSSAQNAALYGLAIDTGARKRELCGLRWSDVDLEAGRVQVVQQLEKGGETPTFGPTKNKRPRSIAIGAETVALLRSHKREQAEFKFANRTTYRDFGLVFAKDYDALQKRSDYLGEPLQANNLGERSFDKLIKAANVKRITFHGLRHTSATLLLRAGVAAHVVAERLGHSDVSITLNVYAHVLPDMQQSAAERLAAVLHAR